MENQTAPAVTNTSIVEEIIPLFEHIGSITEDVKSILKKAKDAQLDAPMLSKIAKAKADQKLGDLIDKTESLLDLAESLK